MNSDTLVKGGYSAKDVMAVEIPIYLMMLSPHDKIISRVYPEALELYLDGFSRDQMAEINEHLRSYTEKILLTEKGGRIWGFLPSTFPSATLFLSFVTDEAILSAADLLRLVKEEEHEGYFTLSDSISTRPSRMSERLVDLKERYKEFFDALISAFSCMSALEETDAESARDELYKRIYAVSRITGCPVGSIDEKGEDSDYTKTDLPLFVAFLFCFLAFAKRNSPLRSVDISLASSSSSAVITISFEAQGSITLADELVEWETLSAERNMMFGFSVEDNRASITFQPLRR
ncbi:MAG: hypothetical protein IIV11_00685, partial [Clostridia bacterium]|nr:hypothetical protein [Clostridia bacterium]